MAQIEQSGGDDKKKGGQKKKHIHVDFTPMVDMNMLLITFFMLCTTMIHSKTLSIALPAPPDPNEQRTVDNSEAVHEEDAVTLIIDTERVLDKDGNPTRQIQADEQGNLEIIYYYYGKEPVVGEDGKVVAEDAARIKAERFIGNTSENGETKYNGIRNVLYGRNKDVVNEVNALKKDVKEGKMTLDEFNDKAKEIRAKYAEHSPKVTIKATDEAAWQSVISALDEMQINQIAQYRISTFTDADQAVIDTYKAANGK